MAHMTVRRVLAAAAVTAVLVTSLTACFTLPGLPGNDNGNGNGTVDDGSALVDTTWNGIDSNGDQWGMTFQEDGTIGLNLNGNDYDDATDVWDVSGGEITISIALVRGEAVFTGDYDGIDEPLELDGDYVDGPFTLTLERD